MLVLKRKNGLYIPEDQFADPGGVVLAALFATEPAEPRDTYTLEDTWTKPDTPSLYAFFPAHPGIGDEEWKVFAEALIKTFRDDRAGGENSRFGWFDATGENPDKVYIKTQEFQGRVLVEGTTEYRLSRNVALDIGRPGSGLPTIELEDDVFVFMIGGDLKINSGSAEVPEPIALPMVENSQTPQGVLSFSVALTDSQIAELETGCMFFQQDPVNDALIRYRYPIFRALEDGGTLAFKGSWDVRAGLDPHRTYLAFESPQVRSHVSDTLGRPVDLKPQDKSSLVFALRPNFVGDGSGQDLYLTPDGGFEMIPQTVLGEGAEDGYGLLCGLTGSEYFTFTTDTNATNAANAEGGSLYFSPGRPAWDNTVAENGKSTAAARRTALREAENSTPADLYLTNPGGIYSTSWVRVLPSGQPFNEYSAQPESSLLFAPKEQGSVLMNFRQAGVRFGDGENLEMPEVPMVPYLGVDIRGNITAAQFSALEAQVLYPARRETLNETVVAFLRSGGTMARQSENLERTITPPGVLVELNANDWQNALLGTYNDRDGAPAYLALDEMRTEIQTSLQQSRIFNVLSTTVDQKNGTPLYDFARDALRISGWTFDLSPGTEGIQPGADPNNPVEFPPIVLMKYYQGETVQELVAALDLWSFPEVFNQYSGGEQPSGQPTAAELVQQFLTGVIDQAIERKDDPLYRKFAQAVTDPNWSGVLGIACRIDLSELDPAIKGLLPGMCLEYFRAHHVGVEISNLDARTLELDKSSTFGLIDYQPTEEQCPATTFNNGSDGRDLIRYLYHVNFLKVLFQNSNIESFDAQIQLGLNGFFKLEVSLMEEHGVAAENNIILINGAYESNGEGENDGIYSFVTETNFNFNFVENYYLKSLTVDKIQFAVSEVQPEGGDERIRAGFSIWGNMAFEKLQVLDLLSFDKLVFSNLGLSLDFLLGKAKNATLGFSPGTLTFNFGESKKREETDSADSTSLLNSLPLRLTSFIYNDDNNVTLQSQGYSAMSLFDFSGGGNPSEVTNFTYGLNFELDLGSLGALVGLQASFKCDFLIGWEAFADVPAAGLAVGVKLPSVQGKLEIGIQGVLKLVIEQFQFKTTEIDGLQVMVISLLRTSLEIMGTPIPNKDAQFDFLMFAPQNNFDQVAWLAGAKNLEVGADLLKVPYLGAGQRVGPAASEGISNFQGIMKWVDETLVKAVEDGEYGKVYRPEADWLVVGQLSFFPSEENKNGLFSIGVVFYDPVLYGVRIEIPQLFNFEITYTKVTDEIGKWFIEVSVPDAIRRVQMGAFGFVLPVLGLTIFTNGDFRIDLGFPEGDDWSRSFQVQAQAGPLPLTGSGGFYLEKLSSATSNFFPGCVFETILGAGIAVRVGLGKDFKAGILSAGLSLTYFGIIEGHLAYGLIENGKPSSSGGNFVDLFSQPEAISVKGVFGIIGEVYGSVDFGIISAAVNIRLQASIGVLLESGQKMLLWVEASVLASATVKVLFVKISFKFSMTLRFDFEIAYPGWDSLKCIQNPQSLRAAERPALPMWGAAAEPLTLRTDCFAPATYTRPLGRERRRARAARKAGLTQDGTGQPLVDFETAFAAREAAPTDVLTLYLLSEITLEQTAEGQTFQVELSTGIETGDPEGGDPDRGSDFDILVEKLVRWCASSFMGDSGHNPRMARADLVALNNALHATRTLARTAPRYGAMAEAEDCVLDWEKIKEFLLANYEKIVVQALDPDDEGDLQAASVFPMLPALTLTTEGRDPEIERSFATYNLRSLAYQDLIDAYFDRLRVFDSFGDAASGALLAVEDLSIATIVIQDYFDFLLKGAVEELDAAAVELQRRGEDEFTLDDLFAEAGEFSDLAGQASAYFRAGLVLPVDVDDPALEGLYTLTGQQFAAATGDAYSAKLEANADRCLLSDPTKCLVIDTAKAVVEVDPEALGNPGEISVTPQILRGPEQLIPVETHPASWTFNRSVVWTLPEDAGEKTILPMPPALLGSIAGDPGRTIEVKVLQGSAGELYSSTAGDPPIVDHLWATQIRLTVKRVPAVPSAADPEADGFLENVYQIGGADASNRELIRQLLADPNLVDPSTGCPPSQTIGDRAFEFHLLFPKTTDETGELMEGNTTRFLPFEVRSNLTDVTRPPQNLALARMATDGAVDSNATVVASLEQQRSFLEILLDASVTNAGGYWLFYRQDDGEGFPESTFADNSVAPLTLMVVRTQVETVEGDWEPLAGYYNTLLLTDQGASKEKEVYYAQARNVESTEISIALGVVGVDLMVKNPDPSGGGTGTPLEQQIQLLYQNMGFTLTGSEAFTGIDNSLPVGPLDPETSGTDDWLYRLFLPIYKFAKIGTEPDAAANLNPYASIGQPFQVGLEFRDSFGNVLLDDRPSPVDGNNLYFDELVPLSEWTAVGYDYGFTTEPLGDGSPQTADNTLFMYVKVDASTLRSIANEPVPGEPGVESPLDATIKLYETIRLQITPITDGQGNPEVTTQLYFRNSLNPAGYEQHEVIANGGGLIELVDEILEYLAELKKDPNAGKTFPTLIIPSTVAAGSGPSDLDVFEVLLSFGIERIRYVDEEAAAAVPAVRQVSDLVTPQLTAGAPGADSMEAISTGTLAYYFEQAFADVSLAMGNGALGDQSFYATRKRLLDVRIQQEPADQLPTYFAPAPLDNQLVSGFAPVPVYGPDYEPIDEVAQNFTNADLDSYAQTLFGAVDTVLGADNSVAAARIGRYGCQQGWIPDQGQEPVVTLSRSRAESAEEYSEHQVRLLFQGAVPGARQQGVDVLADQMKASLSTAYVVDTLVQLPVHWNQQLPNNVSHLRLFGQVIEPGKEPSNPTDENYLFSSAKVLMPSEDPQVPAPYLTFTFSTASPARRSSVDLKLAYQISHIEQVLLTEDGEQDSNWLQVIASTDPTTPPDQTTLEQRNRFTRPILGIDGAESIDIPIPLRQFPVPPTLIVQTWEQKRNVPRGEQPPEGGCFTSEPPYGAAEQIDLARRWCYQTEYQRPAVGQDTVIAGLHYNAQNRQVSAQARSQMRLAATGLTLFESLARFSAAFVELGPELEQLVPVAALLDADNPDEQELRKMFNVLTALADLVQQVQNNSTWNPDPAFARMVGANSLDPISVYYTVCTLEDTDTTRKLRLCRKDGQSMEGEAVFIVPLDSEGAAEPIVGDPHYVPEGCLVGETGCYQVVYRPTNIEAPWLRRSIHAQGLDMLWRENAWSTVQLERNRLLIVGQETEEDFIYKTAEVKSIEPLTPLLSTSEPIDIAELSTSPVQPLGTHLSNMLDAVFGVTAGSPGSSVDRRLRVLVRYAAPLQSKEEELLRSVVPVKLLGPETVEVSPGGPNPDLDEMAEELAVEINRWAAGRTLTPEAHYTFSIDLFATLSELNQPIQSLVDLRLNLSDIEEG